MTTYWLINKWSRKVYGPFTLAQARAERDAAPDPETWVIVQEVGTR